MKENFFFFNFVYKTQHVLLTVYTSFFRDFNLQIFQINLCLFAILAHISRGGRASSSEFSLATEILIDSFLTLK